MDFPASHGVRRYWRAGRDSSPPRGRRGPPAPTQAPVAALLAAFVASGACLPKTAATAQVDSAGAWASAPQQRAETVAGSGLARFRRGDDPPGAARLPQSRRDGQLVPSEEPYQG